MARYLHDFSALKLALWLLCIADVSYSKEHRFSNRIRLAGNKQVRNALENRMKERQSVVTSMQIPLIRCRPDIFPNLLIAGFCSDTASLNFLCDDLEISFAGSGCAQLEGNFCCYVSLAQGNSLTSVTTTGAPSPVTSTQVAPSTSPPTTASSASPLPVTSQTSQAPVTTSQQTNTASTFRPTTTSTTTLATTMQQSTPRPTSTTTLPPPTTRSSTTAIPTTTPTTITSTTTTPTTTTTATTTTTTTTTTTPTTTRPTTTPTTTSRPTTTATATARPTTTPATTTPISPQCVSQLNTSCPNTQQVILNAMNAVRRQQGAADMLKMVWDAVAAQAAQAWAEGCSFQHGPAVKPTSTFKNSGQNIASGSGSFFTTWDDVINGPGGWNSEGQFVTIGSPCPTNQATGHFTQDIWAKSFQIGCGFAQCGSTRNFVCNFGPAGNIGNPCVAPFTPGTAQNGGVCGRCGGVNSANCDNGLCTNPCPFLNDFTTCNSLIPNSRTCQNPSAPFVQNCAATCNCRDQGLLF